MELGERFVARYGWLVDVRFWVENDDYVKCCLWIKMYRFIWDVVYMIFVYGELRN